MNTFKKKALLYITVLTSPVIAAPQPVMTAATAQFTEPPITQASIYDSVDASHPTEASRVSQRSEHLQGRMAEPPEHLTIEIVNSYGECFPERRCMRLSKVSCSDVNRRLRMVLGHDITTAHASNAGSPTPVGGPIPPGVIPNNTTASFAVPTGWAGNVAFNRANLSISGDVTLLEASFIA